MRDDGRAREMEGGRGQLVIPVDLADLRGAEEAEALPGAASAEKLCR